MSSRLRAMHAGGKGRHPNVTLCAHAHYSAENVKGARNVAPGLFSPVEAATIHEGLVSSKRRLICLNMCVVRLVCLEQQWTVSAAVFYAPSGQRY